MLDEYEDLVLEARKSLTCWKSILKDQSAERNTYGRGPDHVVSVGNKVRSRARDHLCNILATNMASFCLLRTQMRWNLKVIN